jgi:uncharacterized protein (UPF0332 family)
MSFDWGDYIKLAEKLQNETNKNSIEEAYYRSIISRSYYGVFCISRIKAGLEFYRPRPRTGDPGVHEKVISYYKNSNIPEEKLIGKFLDDLRRDRNDADYDRRKRIDKDLAERAILKAKELLNILNRIKSSPTARSTQ